MDASPLLTDDNLAATKAAFKAKRGYRKKSSNIFSHHSLVVMERADYVLIFVAAILTATVMITILVLVAQILPTVNSVQTDIEDVIPRIIDDVRRAETLETQLNQIQQDIRELLNRIPPP
jgi:septal ring factor EnvC (AmiA/AmiB activator)